jgi:hypothetical protein
VFLYPNLEPSRTMLSLLAATDNLFHLLDVFNRGRQVFVPGVGDENVICKNTMSKGASNPCQLKDNRVREVTFYPHSARTPVLIQNTFINIFAQFWILQEWLDNEATEINLQTN